MSTFSRLPATNRLVAMLPRATRARVLASCEEVDLPFGKTLCDAGAPIRHVFFPTDSFISLVTPAASTAAVEVGLVGNEGMHGVTLTLGVDAFPFHALVQGGGPALRMSAASFKREHARSPAMRLQLNRYLYVLMSQFAQSAACMRFHRVEARLARWLLMTQDRAHADRFPITHLFLAWMLGVRRASITEAANALQTRRIISYKRGDMLILNRPALESIACACYATDRVLYLKTLVRAR